MMSCHRTVCSRTLFINQASKLLVKNSDKSGKVYYNVYWNVEYTTKTDVEDLKNNSWIKIGFYIV